jgi:hypothetical protein
MVNVQYIRVVLILTCYTAGGLNFAPHSEGRTWIYYKLPKNISHFSKMKYWENVES